MRRVAELNRCEEAGRCTNEVCLGAGEPMTNTFWWKNRSPHHLHFLPPPFHSRISAHRIIPSSYIASLPNSKIIVTLLSQPGWDTWRWSFSKRQRRCIVKSHTHIFHGLYKSQKPCSLYQEREDLCLFVPSWSDYWESRWVRMRQNLPANDLGI